MTYAEARMIKQSAAKIVELEARIKALEDAQPKKRKRKDATCLPTAS